MTSPIADTDLRKLLPGLIRRAALLGPIGVGIIHQLVMYRRGEISQIYVFVDPPGYVQPFVSVKFEWWLVLLLLSTLVAVSAYWERWKTVPRRLAIPFYIYILFLLIFVVPTP
jgi:hypothetical protein